MTTLEQQLNAAQQTIARMTISQAQDKAHIAALTAQLAGVAAREAQAQLAQLEKEAAAMKAEAPRELKTVVQ